MRAVCNEISRLFFFILCLVQLDALHILSPEHLAEMMLLPLPMPPEDAISHVVNFLVESPDVRKFPEVLHFVVKLAKEVIDFVSLSG